MKIISGVKMELYYKSEELIEYIKSNLLTLTPKKIPEDVSSLVPEKIWKSMALTIRKDIKEMFIVYYYEQWTATSLMAFRVLEQVLRIHVEYDLNENEVKNIGESIKILKGRKYSETLIIDLENLKELRNNFMHGKQRASIENTKRIIGYVMSMALQIYNIKPH